LDKDLIMSGIRFALDHLHSIGVAHNDLNPANIMIGGGNQPVLIDFRSCQPFSKRLMSTRTPGWCEKEFNTSDKSHDEFGFRKLGPWLDELVKEVEESTAPGTVTNGAGG
jgi:serine/threonine protein kinase